MREAKTGKDKAQVMGQVMREAKFRKKEAQDIGLYIIHAEDKGLWRMDPTATEDAAAKPEQKEELSPEGKSIEWEPAADDGFCESPVHIHTITVWWVTKLDIK